MPRTKRRPGVVKGQTKREQSKHAYRCQKRAAEMRIERQRKERLERQSEVFDKYANYPSHRPMPHPGAPR